MGTEIGLLQIKRTKALIPISIEENRLKQKEELLSTVKKEIEKRAEDINETRDLLEDKLDIVGEREQNVAELERKTINKQLTAEKDSTAIAKQKKLLNVQISAFLKKVDKDKKETDIAKTDIILKERSLLSKEAKLKEKEEELSKWAILLQDERGTLDRIIKRGNK